MNISHLPHHHYGVVLSGTTTVLFVIVIDGTVPTLVTFGTVLAV